MRHANLEKTYRMKEHLFTLMISGVELLHIVMNWSRIKSAISMLLLIHAINHFKHSITGVFHTSHTSNDTFFIG